MRSQRDAPHRLCAFCGGNLVRLSSLPRHFLFRTLSRPLYFSATFLLVGQEIVHSQNPQFSLRFGEFSHLLSLSITHTHTQTVFSCPWPGQTTYACILWCVYVCQCEIFVITSSYKVSHENSPYTPFPINLLLVMRMKLCTPFKHGFTVLFFPLFLHTLSTYLLTGNPSIIQLCRVDLEFFFL